MSAEEVRLLMWQMLHALKYLHALNVWHRDIKSSNVMLGRKEGHKMVKVHFRMLFFNQGTRRLPMICELGGTRRLRRRTYFTASSYKSLNRCTESLNASQVSSVTCLSDTTYSAAGRLWLLAVCNTGRVSVRRAGCTRA